MSANSPASSIYRSLINSLSSYIYPDIFFYCLRKMDFGEFAGSIPRTIGNCTLIEEINFSENNLTGEIKPNWPFLTYLVLISSIEFQ